MQMLQLTTAKMVNYEQVDNFLVYKTLFFVNFYISDPFRATSRRSADQLNLLQNKCRH